MVRIIGFLCLFVVEISYGYTEPLTVEQGILTYHTELKFEPAAKLRVREHILLRHRQPVFQRSIPVGQDIYINSITINNQQAAYDVDWQDNAHQVKIYPSAASQEKYQLLVLDYVVTHAWQAQDQDWLLAWPVVNNNDFNVLTTSLKVTSDQSLANFAYQADQAVEALQHSEKQIFLQANQSLSPGEGLTLHWRVNQEKAPWLAPPSSLFSMTISEQYGYSIAILLFVLLSGYFLWGVWHGAVQGRPMSCIIPSALAVVIFFLLAFSAEKPAIALFLIAWCTVWMVACYYCTLLFMVGWQQSHVKHPVAHRLAYGLFLLFILNTVIGGVSAMVLFMELLPGVGIWMVLAVLTVNACFYWWRQGAITSNMTGNV